VPAGARNFAFRAASRAGRQAEVRAGPLLGQAFPRPGRHPASCCPAGLLSRPGTGPCRLRHTGAGFNGRGHALRCLRSLGKRNIRRSGRRRAGAPRGLGPRL